MIRIFFFSLSLSSISIDTARDASPVARVPLSTPLGNSDTGSSTDYSDIGSSTGYSDTESSTDYSAVVCCSRVHYRTSQLKLTKAILRQEAVLEGRKHEALRSQKPLRLIRDEEVGGIGDFFCISYTCSLHCHHQNDSALRWADV